jgi:hypothetical protein
MVEENGGHEKTSAGLIHMDSSRVLSDVQSYFA